MVTWSGHKFTSPVQLSIWDGEDAGGVYAIMFRPDHKTKPNIYKILYFGETGIFDNRGIKSHDNLKCFKDNSKGNALHISILKTSTKSERMKIEKFLIKKHDPPCNDEYT